MMLFTYCAFSSQPPVLTALFSELRKHLKLGKDDTSRADKIMDALGTGYFEKGKQEGCLNSQVRAGVTEGWIATEDG